MKRIYFSRHAKSSWGDLTLKDIDRPLNSRGKRDAPLMAEKLAQKIDQIDICISSPAKRTRSSAKQFRKILQFDDYSIANKIYHGSIEDVMDVVHSIDPKHESALIFGHNPTFTYLYNKFCTAPIDNLPTSGLFELISTAPSWFDIDTTNTKVGFLIYPKMYL